MDQRKKVGHNSDKMIIYGSKKVVAQELSKRARMKRTKVWNPNRVIITLKRMILKDNQWILKIKMILYMFRKNNLIVML